MFGIPVCVQPWFWLTAAILSWSAVDIGFEYLLISVACILVSILAHELGHALTARWFGLRPMIVLHAFGGLALDVGGLRERWKRLCVTLAGPAAGLGLWLLLSFIFTPGLAPIQQWNYALWVLLFVNLYWNLLNLLPIYPLDGGQISAELFTWADPYHGLRRTLQVSLVFAGFMAIHGLILSKGASPAYRSWFGWIPGSTFSAILFGLLVLQNYQMLQQLPARRGYDNDRLPWGR